MVNVADYTYDADGDVTSVTQHVGGSAADRTTTYEYDWRDRFVYAIAPADDQGRVTYTYDQYDNLGEVTETQTFYAASYPTIDTNTDQLLTQSKTYYDSLGRDYQTVTYGVDSSGNTTGTLTDNTWYDADGNVIKTRAAGSQEFTKTLYDGVGQVVAEYTGYAPGGETTQQLYDNANLNLANDLIFDETDYQYDAAGNVTETIDYQRGSNATSSQTGPLSGLSSSYVRVSYTAAWYDGAGRQVVTADYGTNGGSTLSRPDHVPVWNWDNVHATWQDPSGTAIGAIVTGTSYNSAGYVYQTRDPKGYVSETLYDAAGETTETIQDLVTGGTGSDENVTTYYAYTPDGQNASQTVVDPSLGNVNPTVSNETVPINSASHPAGSTAYLMYSAEDLPTRFGLSGATGRHFLVVQCGGSTGWEYDNGSGLIAFQPCSSDVLVASITFGTSSNTITAIAQNGMFEGIQYATSNATITYTVGSASFTVSSGSFSAPINETTTYVYGTTLSDSGVARSDLLRAVIDPDSTNTPQDVASGSTTGYDRVEYKYDRLGERTEVKDQNQTVHDYVFDNLGRQTEDCVTSLGAGIDGTTRRIEERLRRARPRIRRQELRQRHARLGQRPERGLPPVQRLRPDDGGIPGGRANHLQRQHPGGRHPGGPVRLRPHHRRWRVHQGAAADGDDVSQRPHPALRLQFRRRRRPGPREFPRRRRRLRQRGPNAGCLHLLRSGHGRHRRLLQPQVKLDYTDGSGNSPPSTSSAGHRPEMDRLQRDADGDRGVPPTATMRTATLCGSKTSLPPVNRLPVSG